MSMVFRQNQNPTNILDARTQRIGQVGHTGEKRPPSHNQSENVKNVKCEKY